MVASSRVESRIRMVAMAAMAGRDRTLKEGTLLVAAHQWEYA
ncbi:hypothetical protein SAMN04488129_1233 [Halomonas daqiaonensis]|uniref:Uncharacterized protein n=1 Tax=Halomonas daqiaonensis TaxID=650850 RepID=A0A1H7V475_9GAMM|nr:hypothetical protein SAMN04488129_1233 [Halomonas daqiaonensis]